MTTEKEPTEGMMHQQFSDGRLREHLLKNKTPDELADEIINLRRELLYCRIQNAILRGHKNYLEKVLARRKEKDHHDK